MSRLSTMSFGLSAVVAVLIVGLVLADDPPKWDQTPGDSTPFTGKACTDKTGSEPCKYTVGTCYAVGNGITKPPPRNAINGTAVKSVKADEAYPWGGCLAAGASSNDECYQFPYAPCMKFKAYSQPDCVNPIQREDGMGDATTTLWVQKACVPNVVIGTPIE